MIPIVDHGKNFYGILNYCMKKQGAYLIGPRQGDVSELASELKECASINDRVKKPVLHLTMSLPFDEHLTDNQWCQVAFRMLNKLGYEQNPYVIVRHTDEPQEHVHIIASRVRLDTGRVPNDRRENERACYQADQIEKDFGLQRVAYNWAKDSLSIKRGEKELYKKTGKASHKAMVAYRIKAALKNSNNVQEFLDQLEAFNVGVKANMGGEHVSGISFELDGQVFKGSKVGFSWKKLAKKLNYTKADNQALENAKERINKPPSALGGEAQADLRHELTIMLLEETMRGKGYLSIAALIGYAAQKIQFQNRLLNRRDLDEDEDEEKENERRRRGAL